MTTLLKHLPIIRLEKPELHLGALGPISAEVWSMEMRMELLRASKKQSMRLHEPNETIGTCPYPAFLVERGFSRLPTLIRSRRVSARSSRDMAPIHGHVIL